MSFNLTGSDLDTFYAINSVVQILLFSIFHQPVIFLDVLCIAAMLFARAINWQIKATIINIFAAEIVSSIGLSILYVGYLIRASSNSVLAVLDWVSQYLLS